MALTMLAANNASTLLVSDISAASTTLQVSTGTGNQFPSPVSGTSYFKVTLTSLAAGRTKEIVHVTARSGDTFTILRGQEGTSPAAWPSGSSVANLFTAGTFTDMAQAKDVQAVYDTLAASGGAAAVGALNDTGSATTVQGALALKVADTTLAGTGAGKGANIVGYKSALAGAVARTIQSKFAEFVSVKDFGAVGDGVTDDTAAIQAAVGACIGGDRTLYIPEGKYKITSKISIPLGAITHLHIRGAGTHQSTFRVYGAQELFSITGDYGNYWINSVTPNGSFELTDVTVACYGGVDNSGTAMNFDMGSQLGRPNHGIRMRNVTFKTESGYFAYAIRFINSAQINLDSCRFFSGNGVQQGIGIYGRCAEGQDGGGMFVNNCEFFFYQHGIYVVDRFEGTYITSSAFINCAYGTTAVEAGSESGMLITNSEYDCMYEGIHLEGMYDFVITGNCFLAQDADGQVAISVKNGSGFTITGNKIEGTSPTTGTGILLENTDDTLTRASYVGSNSIANCNIAMQITNCSNITFGPWAWKSCTLDTNAGGTNAYIQQGCYEKNTTIVKTLSASTATWTITIDISDMRLTRTPKFANLVSQSASNMISQYNYSASSNTSVVFVVVLGNGGTIAANPYRFGLSIRQPYFDI